MGIRQGTSPPHAPSFNTHRHRPCLILFSFCACSCSGPAAGSLCGSVCRVTAGFVCRCSPFSSTLRTTPPPTAPPATPTSRPPTSSSSPLAPTRLPVTPTSRPPPPTPSPSTSKFLHQERSACRRTIPKKTPLLLGSAHSEV